MNKKSLFLILFYLGLLSQIRAGNQNDLIMNHKVGIVLDNVDVFSDSTIVSKYKTSFPKNSVLKILQESKNEYDELDQNQVYKWYKVETESGKTGWIYGDNFAVILDKYLIKSVAQPLHRSIKYFGEKNGKSILWQARIDGHDIGNNTHTTYQETYLVITNEYGKSEIILIESKSSEGQKQLNNIQLLDLTKDEIPDIILETTSVPIITNLPSRYIEIFNFSSSKLKTIFTERLDLAYFNGEKSPAIAKFVNISKNMIRIEYVDFYNKKHPEYQPEIIINPNNEMGLQYIVKTYTWEPHKKQFRDLYKPVYVSPTAICRSYTKIYSTTKFNAQVISPISHGTSFQVLKIHRKKILRSNKKTVELFFEILLPDGVRGFIKSEFVAFRTGQHQDMLNAYFNRNNLFFPVSFLKISNPNSLVKK